MDRLAAVVLCGGGSRRMGREKALIEVRGRALVDVLAERLAAIADPVLLAPGRPGRLGPRPYPEVADAAPDAGPLGGVIAALEASSRPLLAVVAVDMPFANPELLKLLAHLHDGEEAVVPMTDAGLQPLHAVYSSSALPQLRNALESGHRGMRHTLAAMTIRTVGREEWGSVDPSDRFAANLNRPEDLGLLSL